MRVVKDLDINEASQGGRKASTSSENLEGHVLKDLDEQLCGKLDKRELTIPMMTSSSHDVVVVHDVLRAQRRSSSLP